MAKYTSNFYFDNFKMSAIHAREAAVMLKDYLNKFDARVLDKKMEEMHSIEHRGDETKHEMLSALTVAFITPLERDDMIKLSELIDDVTDSIEDILIHIYCNNIVEIREDLADFTNVVVDCCDLLVKLLDEFKNFKKSKKLIDIIIEINHLEELGDELYIKAMRKLHNNMNNTFEIIVWREIYTMFEMIYDNCEHVADVVESVVIGNT